MQSSLTGESLPVTKKPGDEVYSGSTCKQGEIEAVVIATGVHTFFGKAAHLVDTTNQVGHFQKVRATWLCVHFMRLEVVPAGAGQWWHKSHLFVCPHLLCCGNVQVLRSIGSFCIASIFIGIVIELIVMYPIQNRKYRDGINNILVLLIGGIPIAMPTVLSVTMAIGSHRLSQQVSHRKCFAAPISECRSRKLFLSTSFCYTRVPLRSA